jgi:hypothetical protein
MIQRLLHSKNFPVREVGAAILSLFDFTLDQSVEMYRAKATLGARRFVQEKAIAFEALSEAGFDKIDPDRQEQLAAVKRGSTMTGGALSPSCALLSSKASPFSFHFLTTTQQ